MNFYALVSKTFGTLAVQEETGFPVLYGTRQEARVNKCYNEKIRKIAIVDVKTGEELVTA